MLNRYINTERLGVIEVDRIITKHIGWIFREQPIVDVGVDAIIEQSENGIPTGKFIAVQIKSGKGNFHLSDKKLTHYVTHIHYNYWLNLNIPIILIAHLPETEKTYWQQISDDNFKKTKKQWCIEIPINQELTAKSKDKLTQILSSGDEPSFVFDLYKGNIEPNTLFDLSENINCLTESRICVDNIANLILDLTSKTDDLNIKLWKYSDDKLTLSDPQVKASIRAFARDMNICSKRMEHEIELFSKLYSEGFYSYEQVILLNIQINQSYGILNDAILVIGNTPSAIDSALVGISKMRQSVSKLPNSNAILKESKSFMINVLDLIIREFIESREMAFKVQNKIDLK